MKENDSMPFLSYSTEILSFQLNTCQWPSVWQNASVKTSLLLLNVRTFQRSCF